MVAGPGAFGKVASAMQVVSPAFEDGSPIPARFAMKAVAGGENVSVPLGWTGAPDATRAFAIAVIDRHPVAKDWVHWLVVDVPADASSIPESASGTAAMPPGSRELDSSFGSPGWGGPQPPRGTGPHRYESTVYALDLSSLVMPSRAAWPDVSRAMDGHILASATLTGTFEL